MTALLLILAMGASGTSPPEAPVVSQDETSVEFTTHVTVKSAFNTYEFGPGIYLPEAPYAKLNEEIVRLQKVERDAWRSSNTFFIGLGVGAGLMLTAVLLLVGYMGWIPGFK